MGILTKKQFLQSNLSHLSFLISYLPLGICSIPYFTKSIMFDASKVKLYNLTSIAGDIDGKKVAAL